MSTSYPKVSTTAQQIDRYLESYSQKKTRQAALVHPQYERLWRAVSQVVSAGGKRLRPYMTLLAYRLYSDQPNEHVLTVAVAQELLHCAMLVHDDIIDRDDTRRGKLNISGLYEREYAQYVDDAQVRRHYVNSTALLAGDVLLSEAYGLLSMSEFDKKKKEAMVAIMREAAFDVIGGELIDTEPAFIPGYDVSAGVVAQYKTAHYSFRAPLTIGAVAAGASKAEVKKLRELSLAVGLGFQWRDDLLGTFGDTDRTGKSIDGDIREGKHTVLVERFLQIASEDDATTYRQLYKSAELAADQIEQVRTMWRNYDLPKQIEAMIQEKVDAANRVIQSMQIDDDGKQKLIELVNLSCFREK